MTQYIVHIYREMRLSYTGIEADTPEARLDHLTRARAACAKIFTALDRAITAEQKPAGASASARVSEVIAAGEPLHMADVIEICRPPFNSLP